MTKTEESKSVGIGKKLYDSIKEYCDLNHLQVKEYVNTLLNKAFMEDKYGTAPPVITKKPKVQVEEVAEEVEKPKEEKKIVEIVVEEEKVVEKPKKKEEKKEQDIIVKPIRKRTL